MYLYQEYLVEERRLYRPITHWSFLMNEWRDLGLDPAQVLPLTPEKLDPTRCESSHESKQIQEAKEDHSWFEPEQLGNTTSFNFVNKNRKAIEVGD